MLKRLVQAVACGLLFAGTLHAQMTAGGAITVTPDNFIRAESDRYFSLFVKRDGSFGKFHHFRNLPSLKGTGVRPNRDTFYSEAVFDLDAGPVTIKLPDAGSRFMSLMALNEDHYVTNVVHGAGEQTYTRAQVGTRYLLLIVRTFVDTRDPRDIERTHALQDAIEVRQPGGPGRLDLPQWDTDSLDKVRGALVALGETLPNMRRAFGARGQVDPVRHLIGAAIAWGGNPDAEALYLNVTPKQNDGKTIYTLKVGDVPVDAFWSISVYNRSGYFEPNAYDAYALNNVTAKKGEDGSIVIQFGGCDGEVANCLPTMEGWNYMVRLYRPRAEVLEGRSTFPQARPAT